MVAPRDTSRREGGGRRCVLHSSRQQHDPTAGRGGRVRGNDRLGGVLNHSQRSRSRTRPTYRITRVGRSYGHAAGRRRCVDHKASTGPSAARRELAGRVGECTSCAAVTPGDGPRRRRTHVTGVRNRGRVEQRHPTHAGGLTRRDGGRCRGSARAVGE